MRIYIIEDKNDTIYAKDFKIALVKMIRKTDYLTRLEVLKTRKNSNLFVTKLRIK